MESASATESETRNKKERDGGKKDEEARKDVNMMGIRNPGVTETVREGERESVTVAAAKGFAAMIPLR